MINTRNNSSDLNSLEDLNQKLKSRYDFYQKRISEVSRRSAHFIPNILLTNKTSTLKETLRKLQKELENLKREKESLFNPNSRTLQELEELKSKFDKKIKTLRDENSALKQKKLKNVEEENEKTQNEELSMLRKKVKELENIHEKNFKTIEGLKDKLDAEKKVGKQGRPSEIGGEEKDVDKLRKLENNLKNFIKSDAAKYKGILKELESSLEKLNSDKICLQMKILKTRQQERLLQLSIDQGNDGRQNESNYTEANFLYKPSIKSLYY